MMRTLSVSCIMMPKADTAVLRDRRRMRNRASTVAVYAHVSMERALSTLSPCRPMRPPICMGIRITAVAKLSIKNVMRQSRCCQSWLRWSRNLLSFCLVLFPVCLVSIVVVF